MDRQTFDRLMLASLPAAQRFAIRLTNDPHVAEDIVHDALVRAASRWRSFRGESSLQTWLLQILINVWHDRLRHIGQSSELPRDATDQRAANPAASVLEDELGRIVADHVSSLPPRQREVLVLVVYEELTPAEAAKVLGISEQNARVNLHHARQRLKQLLAAYLDVSEREHGKRSIPRE